MLLFKKKSQERDKESSFYKLEKNAGKSREMFFLLMLSRVTRRVCEKFALNVAQSIFSPN
jgi:hypothetical protein